MNDLDLVFVFLITAVVFIIGGSGNNKGSAGGVLTKRPDKPEV
ncbi:hypothetical protein [Selenomonas ruminantium]|nr:hypothetical protein [Selenomonas ruminantium]